MDEELISLSFLNSKIKGLEDTVSKSLPNLGLSMKQSPWLFVELAEVLHRVSFIRSYFLLFLALVLTPRRSPEQRNNIETRGRSSNIFQVKNNVYILQGSSLCHQHLPQPTVPQVTALSPVGSNKSPGFPFSLHLNKRVLKMFEFLSFPKLFNVLA